MSHLIYDKATGEIDSVRASGTMDGAQIIDNAYGIAGTNKFTSMPFSGLYPVGMKIDVASGAVVADPNYIVPVVQPVA